MIFSTLLLLSSPPPLLLYTPPDPLLYLSYLPTSPLLLPTPTRGVSRNLFSFYGGLGTHRGQKTISGGRAPISLHLQYDSVPNPFVIGVQGDNLTLILILKRIVRIFNGSHVNYSKIDFKVKNILVKDFLNEKNAKSL